MKKQSIPKKINLNGSKTKIMAVKMPIRCPARCMSLRPIIQVVINEKRPSNALSVWPQWQWRGFNRHRSVKGADRLWSYHAWHKGAPVSRRHFILVHIPTPMGQPGLWLSGEPEQDYCDRSHTHTHMLNLLLWNHHMHFNMLYSIETNSLAHVLTIEKDPSQWSFVFSEKNKKTG